VDQVDDPSADGRGAGDQTVEAGGPGNRAGTGGSDDVTPPTPGRPLPDLVDTSTGTGAGDAPTELSGGSGGLAPGDYTDLPFTNGDVSTTFHMYVPPDSGYGVIVYLHGDGGGGYSSNYRGRVKSVRRIAEERRLLLINVKSPYRMSDGSPSWRSGDTAKAAKLLHALIQDEIYAKYSVDQARFFITGNSGGPTFITSIFVPAYGMNYRGGAIPVCGGVAPAKDALRPTAEFLRNFKMYFYTETGDFMYRYAPKAVQRYRDAGFEVTAVHPEGSGHCDLDMYEVLTDALDTIDQ
jgi:hypothetical protein